MAPRKFEYQKLIITNVQMEIAKHLNVGIIINSSLKWHTHINHIAKNISKVRGMMYRLPSRIGNIV